MKSLNARLVSEIILVRHYPGHLKDMTYTIYIMFYLSATDTYESLDAHNTEPSSNVVKW